MLKVVQITCNNTGCQKKVSQIFIYDYGKTCFDYEIVMEVTFSHYRPQKPKN